MTASTPEYYWVLLHQPTWSSLAEVLEVHDTEETVWEAAASLGWPPEATPTRCRCWRTAWTPTANETYYIEKVKGLCDRRS